MGVVCIVTSVYLRFCFLSAFTWAFFPLVSLTLFCHIQQTF